jgi:predicted O-methyltransferase YrrM
MSVARDFSLLRSAIGTAARNPRRYVRKAARLPLEEEAAAKIAALPLVELSDLTGDVRDVTVRIADRDTRHTWSLGAAEQLSLQVLIRARRCTTAFEIGTFNGGTTRLLAETLPAEGRVWTLDLPPVEFDTTQGPKGFGGSQVGIGYRDSADAHKVTQLLGNSLHFDFEQYEQSADLVLVDGGHEYEHGVADTRTALRLVRPGGIVLWDDFEPYWHGLVTGICEAMAERRLGRLAGTALAVYCAEP